MARSIRAGRAEARRAGVPDGAASPSRTGFSSGLTYISEHYYDARQCTRSTSLATRSGGGSSSSSPRGSFLRAPSPSSSRRSSGSPSRPSRSTSGSCATAGSPRSGRRAPDACTPLRPRRCTRSTAGWSGSPRSGISASTPSPPSSCAAGASAALPAPTGISRRRHQSMIDIVNEIEAIRREVGTGPIAAGEGRAVRLSRAYDAPVEDVWDALTSPERLTRWFLPISGDYRVGGSYQLEGNAGGRHPRLRAPAPVPGHLGLWRAGGPGRRLRAGDPPYGRGRPAHDARARARRHRPGRSMGRIRAGRGGRRLGPGPAGAGAPTSVASHWTRWPGR